jgi:hypothetical protein
LGGTRPEEEDTTCVFDKDLLGLLVKLALDYGLMLSVSIFIDKARLRV